ACRRGAGRGRTRDGLRSGRRNAPGGKARRGAVAGPMSAGTSAPDEDASALRGPSGLPYRPCAGVVLVNRDGLVFAGQRIDNPGPAWQMPQGGIDPGETPRIAALRELGEEAGIGPELVEVLAE